MLPKAASQLTRSTRFSRILISSATTVRWCVAQAGLASTGNEWVNVQRLYAPGEAEQRNVVTDGTSEWQMRNQFRAWVKFMTMGA